MPTVASHPFLEPFASSLLAADLPGLPSHRRAEAVGFVCGRVDMMPGPTRAALLAVAAAFRVAMLLPMRRRLVRAAARTTMPLAGDYVRLIRSLGYAYVWERWPGTLADGRAP